MPISPPTAHTACRATLMLALIAAMPAWAQTRWVLLNGRRLADAEIQVYDRLQCAHIPNGAYWLNARTGHWGYAGNPVPQGVLGDLCRAGAAGQRRPSLSERGMLYRPGELLNPR